jgi:hypothetical protein
MFSNVLLAFPVPQFDQEVKIHRENQVSCRKHKNYYSLKSAMDLGRYLDHFKYT